MTPFGDVFTQLMVFSGLAQLTHHRSPRGRCATTFRDFQGLGFGNLFLDTENLACVSLAWMRGPRW